MLLRQHPWGFDRGYIQISPLVTTDVLPVSWKYQYDIPNDCARLISITSQDFRIPFERMGNRILTNCDSIELRYSKNYSSIDEGLLFPDDFAETLALFLAMDLCMKLTQNVSLRESLIHDFQYQLSSARFNGAVEMPDSAIESCGWLNAHNNSTDIDIGGRNLAN